MESRQQAKSLIPKIYQKLSDEVNQGSYSAIHEFATDFDKMRKAFLDNTQEPESYQVLEEFTSTTVMDDLEGLMRIETD